jgi:hypothetical protein
MAYPASFLSSASASSSSMLSSSLSAAEGILKGLELVFQVRTL